MRYLKKFATRAEYDAFMETNTDFPFVGYIKDEGAVEYMAHQPSIQFEDAEVLRVLLANGVGSDGVITERQARAVTSIGTWFQSNTTITSFKELQYFTSITALGDSNLNYGGATFYKCSNLEVVHLPNSLSSIGNYVFYQCSKLKKIVCHAITPPSLQSYSLSGVDWGVDFYVPDESVDAYKTKWSKVASSIYPLSQYTE
jgi:hypothetical protein